MHEIKLDYVGCKTARENLAVANNTWLHPHEIDEMKTIADSGTDEQCIKFKEKMERVLTDRVNTCLAWY